MHRVRILALAVSLAFVVSATARADDTPTAADLKQQGDTAMDSLHYEEAIAHYTAALALSPAPAILYNRGRAYQARGQYVEALADIERFDREAPPDVRTKVPKLAALLAELRAKISTLSVTSNVAGARVVVRDKIVGETPLPAAVKLPAGPATIEVSAEGHATFRRNLELPGGGELIVDATLVRTDTSGVLVVKAPLEATVVVDGAVVGKGNVELAVAAGNHSIVGRKPGEDEASTTALVAVGEHKEVSLSFAASRPITTKWWFWTGVAVVVAGGAATTIALLAEKSAPHGDRFAPDQTRAPLVARW